MKPPSMQMCPTPPVRKRYHCWHVTGVEDITEDHGKFGVIKAGERTLYECCSCGKTQRA